MRAPSMGVRTRGLGLFSPSGQAQGNHLPPRTEKLEIVIPHAGVIERPRQVKAKVVSGMGHGRQSSARRKLRVTDGKNSAQECFLLPPWNPIQPGRPGVGLL